MKTKTFCRILSLCMAFALMLSAAGIGSNGQGASLQKRCDEPSVLVSQ